jgi:putative MATE family efflux protein
LSTVPGAAALPRGVTEPIPREMLRLALPVLASQLLRVAYQWVDALWVRGLGVDATAAVTTSVFVMWMVYSLQDVFGIGVAAYVSQLLGAGERARAGVAAYRGIRASALAGLACALAVGFGARGIYVLMNAPPSVVESGGRYLSIVLGAAPLPMVALTSETIMRSSGDTRTPLLVTLGAVLLNAALAPLLIYGWGGFPKLGVAGAAWATVIAQAVMVAAYLTLAARRHPAFPLSRTAAGGGVRVRDLARVGLPAALIGVMFSVVYLAFSRSAARFGAASLAIVGIANRVEALQFVTAASLGMAGATLVGQNLGAGRPDRAVRAIRTGLAWILWISVAVTALMLAYPGALIGLFTQDPETHRVGVPYLRVLAGCLVFTGVEVVIADSVLGSGHTLVLSWIFTVFSVLRIPLAFWGPDAMRNGALGIAWVITVTCAVRAVLIAAWAARGTWQRGLGHEIGAGVPPMPG